MSFFKLPSWTKNHLFSGSKFADLSQDEIARLKNQIQKFSDPNPDISVVIPVWNEQDNIFRTVSSIVSNTTSLKVELIIINNNSRDNTQQVLDELGVINYFQTLQGTPFARQLGLEKAKGKYHLCADADTLYPPNWIDLMVDPMLKNQKVKGVYGRYSFIPPAGQNRMGFWFYELFTSVIIKIRKKKREYLNTYGFNMGFETIIGLENDGFKVAGNRKYDGVVGNDNVNEAEDGRMARIVSSKGDLVLVTHPKAKVFTSSRRLMDDGSLWQAFIKRIKYQLSILKEFR